MKKKKKGLLAPTRVASTNKLRNAEVEAENGAGAEARRAIFFILGEKIIAPGAPWNTGTKRRVRRCLRCRSDPASPHEQPDASASGRRHANNWESQDVDETEIHEEDDQIVISADGGADQGLPLRHWVVVSLRGSTVATAVATAVKNSSAFFRYSNIPITPSGRNDPNPRFWPWRLTVTETEKP
jgi:hypothetical protein